MLSLLLVLSSQLTYYILQLVSLAVGNIQILQYDNLFTIFNIVVCKCFGDLIGYSVLLLSSKTLLF